MRILLNDYAGHAFPIDLAKELVRRGHEVQHSHCQDNSTPHGDFESAAKAGVEMRPISLGRPFEKYRVFRRAVDELDYGIRSSWQLVRHRPQVAILGQLPIISLLVTVVVAKVLRVKTVLWLQDLQSGLVAAITGGEKPSITSRVSKVLEGLAVRFSDQVVAISEGFADQAVTFGARREDITVIENWAPVDSIPLLPKKNDWAIAHDLDDRLVYLYSGTLGVKHRPEVMIELSRMLHKLDPEARLVVVSEGYGADFLADHVQSQSYVENNLILLPFQPFDDLPMVLASADILLVVLAPEVGEYSVPSKILSYLTSGRTILGHMPLNCPASTMIIDRAEAGEVAQDDETLMKFATILAEDSELRDQYGHSARAFAETTFRISTIGDQFEAILVN